MLLGTMPDESPIPCGACTSAPWTCMGFEGVRLRTTRWDICTTILIPRLHERLPVALESALETMRATLDSDELALPEPRELMTTCLMSDRRQWSNLASVLHPQHAAAMQGLSRGGFTAKGVAVLYDIDHRAHCRDTISLALHEGWHQYAQTALRSPLPPWLDEGLATVMEGYRLKIDGIEIDHAANRQRSRRAWWMIRRGRMQPLAEFTSDDPHAAMARGRSALLEYYAQAWALTRYLMSSNEGLAEVRAILEGAAAGATVSHQRLSTEHDQAFLDWCAASLQPSWWH